MIKLPSEYQFTSFIGSGAFGTVVRCQDVKRNRSVAVKIIPKPKISNWIVYNDQRIPLKVDILLHCHHKNIIQILDYFESVEDFYIVTNVPARRCLKLHEASMDMFQYIENYFPLPERTIKMFFKQAASAIDYLYDMKICHGFANVVKDNIDDRDYGGLGGTVEYWSPEFYTRTCFNRYASDIWALGIVLVVITNKYVMWNGCTPYNADKEYAPVFEGMLQNVPEDRFIIKDVMRLVKLWTVEKD
ncbi:ATP-dependent Lon protease pim1 [Boothiomyces macroporosus]|uniref:ATP-dependent Lon protease pim1 n=1 Tax=Boothiomyces macroporosus TaxID=261099 RepID=A0AAD5Y3X7_9FUNG|nr:ATP-dependent Lon protease pim1 [Boothiomyces macroporosus]